MQKFDSKDAQLEERRLQLYVNVSHEETRILKYFLNLWGYTYYSIVLVRGMCNY